MKLVTILLAATVLLAACGGSSDGKDTAAPAASDPAPSATTTTSSAPAPASAAAEDAGVVVDIVIKDGKATPQGDRVEATVGEPITLNVTSDADEEIHVHSDPEHTYDVAPGDSISESFTIDTPGQIAVEAHHLDVTIVQLVVRP